VTAARVVTHPDYDPVTHNNDIALIELTDKLPLELLGPHIAPICAPNPDDRYDRDETLVVG